MNKLSTTSIHNSLKSVHDTPDMQPFTLSPLRGSVRYFSARAALAGSSRRTTLRVTVLLIALTMINIDTVSASSKPIDLYKLYAHMKIVSASEYRCLETLWMYESKWNPKAKNKNSSAFGIPQLLRLTTKDPFQQIDRGLKYIKARHQTPCKALAYFGKRGHY